MNNSDGKVQVLHDELSRRVKANHGYSMRAFARDLGINPGTLSMVLNRKRALTAKKSEAITRRLSLSADKVAIMLGDVELKKKISRSIIAADQFELIASWHHIGLLTLIGSYKNGVDKTKLYQRLGIKKSLIDLAIMRLSRLHLVKTNENNQVVRTSAPISTSDDIAIKAIKQFHKERLRSSIDVVENIPPSEREFSSTFFALAKSDLSSFKNDLRIALNQVIEKYESSGSEHKAIFNINVQAFEITKD